MENVSFAYPGKETPALEQIDLTIRPHEKIALVGSSGGGKSSLIKLLYRCYEDYSGRISVDGINMQDIRLSDYYADVAMVPLGSDTAIEAADIVLMDDNPMKLALAIRISRKCLRIVYENIVFALAIKAACLVLGAIGKANMWIAIFADVGVMVLAVLNAVRCLQVEKGSGNKNGRP